MLHTQFRTLSSVSLSSVTLSSVTLSSVLGVARCIFKQWPWRGRENEKINKPNKKTLRLYRFLLSWEEGEVDSNWALHGERENVNQNIFIHENIKFCTFRSVPFSYITYAFH